MQFVSIASGSSGNCIFVGSDTTSILVDAGISIYNSIFNSPTTVPALSKKSIGNLVIRTIFGDALKTMVVMTGVHLELAQTILKDGISYSLF